jgi:uncharacterized protein
MKIPNLILGTLFLLMLAGNVHAASFDCGKATTDVEKIICGDDELSKRDDSLSEAYQEALKSEARKTQPEDKIIESQRQWLKKVRNRCQNAACLKKAYETRIRELGWFRGGGTVTAPKPVSGAYARTDLIRDMSAPKETWEYAESTMNLSMKDKNTFEFDLEIYGGGFRTCELSGLAVRRERFFECRIEGPWSLFEGDEPGDCVLKFSFQGDFVRLEDETGKCRAFCGQGASFDRVMMYRSDSHKQVPVGKEK